MKTKTASRSMGQSQKDRPEGQQCRWGRGLVMTPLEIKDGTGHQSTRSIRVRRPTKITPDHGGANQPKEHPFPIF